MARHSRKHTHKRKQQKQRKHRGGVAPVSYNLVGDWSSKMSMGQGADYFKYHEGQRGGMLDGAPLSQVDQSSLPAGMRTAAMQDGPLNAYQAIAGLKDQVGGKRRHRRGTKKHRAKKHRTKSHRSKKHRSTRRRGGSLAFAPFGSRTMLLDNYNEAGLSSSWGKNVEFDMANARNAL